MVKFSEYVPNTTAKQLKWFYLQPNLLAVGSAVAGYGDGDLRQEAPGRAFMPLVHEFVIFKVCAYVLQHDI